MIVDLSEAEATLKRRVISRAKQTILVTTPTITSLRLSRSLIKEISEVRGGDKDSISLVVNMQNLSKVNEVSSSDIEDALEFSVSAHIPFLPSVFLKNESETKGILSDKEGVSMIEAQINPLISKFLSANDEINENSGKNSGIIGGFLTKFTSK